MIFIIAIEVILFTLTGVYLAELLHKWENK